MFSSLAENKFYPEILFHSDLRRGEGIIRKGEMHAENQKIFLREQGQSQNQRSKLGDLSGTAALTSYQPDTRSKIFPL